MRSLIIGQAVNGSLLFHADTARLLKAVTLSLDVLNEVVLTVVQDSVINICRRSSRTNECKQRGPDCTSMIV